MDISWAHQGQIKGDTGKGYNMDKSLVYSIVISLGLSSLL